MPIDGGRLRELLENNFVVNNEVPNAFNWKKKKGWMVS